MKKISAFSLIELSVVLLVISFLITIATQGGVLINAARLTSARSLTSESPVPKIDGLVAWYETSSKDSLIDGERFEDAQVKEWRDISPNSIAKQRNRLTKPASSGVVYKSNGINKIPSLQFDGSSNFTLSDFYQGVSSQNTVFIVFRPLIIPNGQVLIDSDTSHSSSAIGITSNQISITSDTTYTTDTATNPINFVNNGDYVIAVYFNGATSGAYANNATTLVGNSNINPGEVAINGLTIGTAKAGLAGSGLAGLISEVIIYNRPLKLQERKDVMKYLSKKYQIVINGI